MKPNVIIRALSLTSSIGIEEIASLEFRKMLINCHMVLKRNYLLDKYIPPDFIYHVVWRKIQNTITFSIFDWILYILLGMVSETSRLVDLLILRWLMKDWKIAQWVNCLLCKSEDKSLDQQNLHKCYAWKYSPVTLVQEIWSRYRRILGPHWPASLPEAVSSGLRERFFH